MLGRLEGSFEHQKALVRQLELLLEEQKRFTADASHELKTPLSIAKVHCGLLLNTKPTDQEYRESVDSIGESIDRVGCLVQDLLLLAHADAGQLGRQKTSLIPKDLLSRARQHQNTTPGAPIHIEDCDSCGTVLGNEDELVRVFDNLLANARRHTPIEGEITVSCRKAGGNIIVRVADTGEGIEPEHIPHLGERFYRIDSARSRGLGGVGLGLSICKSLLQHNQGSLEFESELGKGTIAIVTLPAEPA
jgi:signal transduction histidine kinase